MPSRGRGLPIGFWAALAAGLALRAWYYADLARQSWHGVPLVDALSFDRMARGLLEGGLPGAYFRPPLYPGFLAAVYALFGRGPAAVVWLQFLLGLAALVPAFLLAERWFGRRAALAAAWIGACYPLRIFLEGELLDVTLFGFLFVTGTWALWRALEERSALRFLLAGLLAGAAAVTRPNLLAALPFAALGGGLALRGRGGFPARHLAAWAAGIALALLPVTAHNWRAERALIPVAANGGINLYLGNAPGATGLTPLPPGLRWEAVVQEPLRSGLAGLAQQDRYWQGRARDAVLADPAGWLRLVAAKTAIFFGAAEPSNNKALRHFTAVSFPVRHYRGWYGALVCLAAAGFAAALLPERGAGGSGPAAGAAREGALFLLPLTAGFALSTVLFFVTERYRLPIVPLLAGVAASGGGAILAALRARSARRAAWLAGLVGAAALLCLPDRFGAGVERISADFQMGQVLLMRGEPAAALAHLERARAADPRDPDVLNSIGAAHFRLGDLDRAGAAYRAALALGDFSEVWFNLGVLAERRGEAHRGEALAAYRRALAINPFEMRARANARHLAGDAAGAPPAAP